VRRGVAREGAATGGSRCSRASALRLRRPLAAQARPRGAIPAREQAVIDTAAEHDVPLTYSDVTGQGEAPRLLARRHAGRRHGEIPRAGREEGDRRRRARGRRAKDELEQTGFRGMNRLKLAAQDGDKSAQRVLDQIENAGDDWQKIMQASGNLKLWRARQAADELYTRVEPRPQPRGNMPLTKTSSRSMTRSPPSRPRSCRTRRCSHAGGAEGQLDKRRPTSRPRASCARISARSCRTSTPARTRWSARRARRSCSDRASALEGDMERIRRGQGGALEKAWKRADEFYKTAVVPYKDKALAKALSSDTPDEIYSQFIRVGRSGAGEDRATKFYDALDPKGKAAVRYGMLANAMDDAAIAGKDTISPAKFAQSLEKIAPGRRLLQGRGQGRRSTAS
jgi:hypothetical protein